MNKEIIQSLLCCAFEGGSNYWYTIIDHNKKDIGVEYVSMLLAENNGWMKIEDTQSGTKHFVHHDQIKQAVALMKDKYPKHYRDAIEENEDADTGDVFLQLLVFGDVIYG